MKLEITYTPTIGSVEKKNTKYNLAQAIIKVWNEVDGMDNGDRKQRIIEALLQVL